MAYERLDEALRQLKTDREREEATSYNAWRFEDVWLDK